MTLECVCALQETLRRVEALARERSAQKLSNSRVGGVARELNELLKVLTRYCGA